MRLHHGPDGPRVTFHRLLCCNACRWPIHLDLSYPVRELPDGQVQLLEADPDPLWAALSAHAAQHT